MTKQTRIIVGVGGIILLIAGAWFALTERVEAPTVTTSQTTQKPPATTNTTASTSAPVVTAPATHPTTAKPSTHPATAAPKSAFALVTYTGNDFLPRKLVITKGMRVRFLNLSDHDMWIASDLHPLHSLYPIKTPKGCSGSIFDECAGVPNGGHWDFVFNVEGTWGYHNDAAINDGGKIVVDLPGEKPPTDAGF